MDVSRIGLNYELQRQFKRLKPGIVLDVGAKGSPYLRYIPQIKYMRLDINAKTNPDICCSVTDIKWPSDYFDTVIATEVLEHVYSPEKAIDEINRVLKPGGVCILSTRFIYPYHPSPKDYYRFTKGALEYLFRKFSEIEVYHHGNRIQAFWEIINVNIFSIILNIFNPLIARIRFKNTNCPLGFVVYAKK